MSWLGSSNSSQTSQSSGDICRICHCESDPQNPLLTPCYCSGSLKFAHQECLQQWLTASETSSCELCKFPFIMHTKVKPFNEWRALDMSGIERRRLFCSILFHCAIATCVIWSLCVLIERASEEVKRGLISWPFWTKLVVVTVGLTGGVVFMYIQCKAYFNLCTRWRSRNRILLIQNAPEKVAPPIATHTLRESPPRLTSATAAFITPQRVSNLSTTTAMTAATSNNVYSAASQGQIVANVESNSQSGFRGGGQSRDAAANVHVDSVIFDSEVVKNPNATQQAVSITKVNRDISSAAFDFNSNPFGRTHDASNEDDVLPSRSKFNRQRHSMWMGSDYEPAAAAVQNQSNVRRYSDTRVIMGSGEQNIFHLTNALPTQSGCSTTTSDQGTAINIEPSPPITTTDILFEATAEQGSNYDDPLELNIQELLELDIRTNVKVPASQGPAGGQARSSQLSVNSDPQMYDRQSLSQEQKYLLTPHSLPNLSTSRENLLQQPK